MTQAPTPGPLSGDDVKLLVKLLDTLKPFAEVAEKLKHCHVVEICEPSPDNPSRNIIPMPREWFERAGDDLEYIAIQLHASGVLSEGQASKITGLDRVSVRREIDRLAPTAPVEESGSERETEEFFAPFEAFRPQPSGETREAGLSVEMVARFMAAGAAEILSLKNDNVTVAGGWASANWKLFVPQAERLRTAMTTPARAEALDEGAAGEPVAWRETFIVEEEGGAAVGIVIDLPDGSQIWTGECSTQLVEDARAREESPEASGQYLVVAAKGEPTRVIAQVATVDDGIALARAIAGHTPAHPSPPRAADADRVRIAVEAIWEIAGGRAADGHNEAGRLARIKDRAAEALAALKSSGVEK